LHFTHIHIYIHTHICPSSSAPIFCSLWTAASIFFPFTVSFVYFCLSYH
jgi:hypothetical protein